MLSSKDFMSDLNAKAYEIISKLESSCHNMMQKLRDFDVSLQQAHQETETLRLRAEQAEKALVDIQTTHKQQEHKAVSDAILDSFDMPIILENPEVEQTLTVDSSGNTHTEIILLQQTISDLEVKSQDLDDKYQTTYRLLQKEMVKVDTMQMELELSQRERDIALRKQSMTPEQKQLLVKLEYENYKIYETIERIDYISEELKKILGEENDAPQDISLQKKSEQV
jgi:hypothetical protein